MLNQDVARAVAEQGRLNYVQVLETCYPARSFSARRYEKNHLKSRRVKCVFVGPAGEVPVRCPKGFDLMMVMGIGFTRRETEDVTELLEKTRPASDVILGIPEQPMQGSAQLKEIYALDFLSRNEPYSQPGAAQDLVKNRRQMVRRQLLEKLAEQLTPDNFKWFWRGNSIDSVRSSSRDAFASAVLEIVYHRSPDVKPCGNSRERDEAVDFLMNIDEPLLLLRDDDRGGARVIQKFLVANGAAEVSEDCGSYMKVRICGAGDGKTKFGSLWNELLYMLLGDGQVLHSCPLDDIWKKFGSRPCGLDISYLNILLAAAMRRYSPCLHVVCDGEIAEGSGSAALHNAWARSAHSQILYLPQAPYKSVQCLSRLVSIFGTPKHRGVVRDMWETAKAAVIEWYDGMDAAASSLEPEEDSPAYILKKLASEKRGEEARDFIGKGIIEAAGFSGLPEGAELDKLSAWVEGGVNAFTAYEDSRRLSLACIIAEQFGGNAEELPEEAEEYVPVLNQLFRRWFERLYPQSGNQKLGAWPAALAEMYALRPEADVKYWFEILPMQFGIPSFSKWKFDYNGLFSSRLVKACLELELWHVEKLFPLPEDPDEAKRKLSHWMRSVMNGARLNEKERESVLIDLMEDYWAPKA